MVDRKKQSMFHFEALFLILFKSIPYNRILDIIAAIESLTFLLWSYFSRYFPNAKRRNLPKYEGIPPLAFLIVDRTYYVNYIEEILDFILY